MILVGTMCAVLWSIGWAMNAPLKQRWSMIAAVFVGVILSHLILPVAHPLRMNTGGSWQVWALLAAFVVVVLVYRQGLRKLRGKAQPERVSLSNTMSDTELDRYARHIVMPEIGGSGQMLLRRSRVLVIGAGGLGAPALQYLAAAGVGTIGIVDDDVVDASNLQRQVIHRDADIGLPKVQSAAQALRDLNPYVTIKTFQQRFNAEIAGELIAEYDIILDGTDNFETRYLINKICVAQKRPLVSGALSQWEGQISLFDPTQSGPCYQCVFPSAPAPEFAPSCSQVGVFTALPGVIGSFMAVEALKYLLGAGTPLLSRMAMYNVLEAQSRVIKTKQRADCPICHPS